MYHKKTQDTKSAHLAIALCRWNKRRIWTAFASNAVLVELINSICKRKGNGTLVTDSTEATLLQSSDR